MKSPIPYNPLEKQNLAESAVRALLKQQVLPIKPPIFNGAGIYAIYYKGNFPLYQPLTDINEESFMTPIYVGKADPKGGRKGGDWDAAPGRALYERLRDHSLSVRQANNLDESHFFCRFLTLDDAWVRLAERLMINWYRPLWNLKLDGFGNNQPGKGRSNQKTSVWDTLHPGRTKAKGLPPSEESVPEIEDQVRTFLATPVELRKIEAADN